MNKKIGILGAGGKMGSWFANYFVNSIPIPPPAPIIVIFSVITIPSVHYLILSCLSLT